MVSITIKRALGIVLFASITVFGVTQLFQGRVSERLPVPKVEPMELNNPWMVLEPEKNMRPLLYWPMADMKNPNVLFLVYFSIDIFKGEAIRIDLNSKTKSIYWFKETQIEGLDNVATRYMLGEKWDESGLLTFVQFNKQDINNSKIYKSNLFIEFNGTVENHTVAHFYGDPVPNQLGTRKAIIRTGSWLVVDKSHEPKAELIRFKIRDSENDKYDIGKFQLSPNKKWLIHTDYPWGMGRIDIFNLEMESPGRFSNE